MRRYKPARVGNERVLQKRSSAHDCVRKRILARSHARSGRSKKADREALTGIRVGWVLSREMKLSSRSRRGQATRKATVLLSIMRDGTTLRGQRPMHARKLLCGNRETLAVPID